MWKNPYTGGSFVRPVVYGHIQPWNATSSTSGGAASHRGHPKFPCVLQFSQETIVTTKTAHHILLPCLGHLCPVQSLHSLSRFLLQLPTYETS